LRVPGGSFFLRAMALLSSAAQTQAQSSRGAPAKKGGIAAAQALAKQKALEKKAKTYKLPLGELAASRRCRTRRRIRFSVS